MAYKTQGYLKLSSDTTTTCGYVHITDVTSYPLPGGEARTEVGYALFWSTDNFAAIIGYDTGNGDDWYIDTDDQYSFQIRAYIAPLWVNGGSYTAATYREIFYYENVFYMQDTNGAVTSEPGTIGGASDWIPMQLGGTDPTGGTIDTDDDLYALFELAFNTNGGDVGISTIYAVTSCAQFTAEKQSCHNWTITDRSGGTVTVGTVKLKKYTGTVLDDELTFTSNECDINLEAYIGGDDGVYIVEIWDSNDVLQAEIVIVDTCDAYECYKQLVRFVICKCSDPCDEDCEEQYSIDDRRYDMNLIWGLHETINKYVYVDKWNYLGVLGIDETRNSFITQVGQMVDKLKIVANRCGLCSSDSSNDLTC